MIEHYYAIVPAAGIGQRMQADRPKQYLSLLGKTVLEHTLENLLKTQLFSKIIVAIAAEDEYWATLTISKHPDILTAAGGKQRADSVLSALNSIVLQVTELDWVLVHDAARPCVTISEIEQLIKELHQEPIGGILALPCHDTLKQVYNHQIEKTLNRQTIWRALTPQMFRYGILKLALKQTQGLSQITDEASAIEYLGLTAKIVEGKSSNIKITQAEDLRLAQFYLEQL